MLQNGSENAGGGIKLTEPKCDVYATVLAASSKNNPQLFSRSIKVQARVKGKSTPCAAAAYVTLVGSNTLRILGTVNLDSTGRGSAFLLPGLRERDKIRVSLVLPNFKGNDIEKTIEPLNAQTKEELPSVRGPSPDSEPQDSPKSAPAVVDDPNSGVVPGTSGESPQLESDTAGEGVPPIAAGAES